MNRFLLSLLAPLLLAACAAERAPLTIADLEVTEPVPGRHMSAGYFKLTNASSEAITVTHVASREFGAVEMHETIIENDIARMRRIEEVTVAAGTSVTFERGGKHLMLMQPDGSPDTVTLEFYSDENLLLSATTRVGASD